MPNIPKKVVDRLVKDAGRFKRILKKAVLNDINEADTVKIVADILSEVFGFDKYTEVTSEYAIRNTYCDLAVKVNNDVKYLIEVKSINSDLKENHLRQAINYGSTEGIQWVILTNGIIWRIYNIRLKKKVEYDKVFEIDFENISPRKKEDQELLFLLAKEGLKNDVIADYHERVQTVNPHVVSAILLNKPTLDTIKRELRRLAPGLRIDVNEIEAILRNDVLKRNIIEGDDLTEAQKRIKKATKKIAKNKAVFK